MKTLGMIGGTSYHSTIDYYKYINELTNQRMGTKVSPPLLLYSIDISLMRTQDFDLISAEYLRFSQMLEKVGAEAIIICANTPHLVVDFVAPQIGIPILHIADAIGAEAVRLGLTKLALLGTKPVMEGQYISDRIKEKHGVECIVPNADDRQHLHDMVANELTQGVFTDESKQWAIRLMEKMQANGADGIILGCTELPILVKQTDFHLPLLDTTLLHSKMAVEFILG